jgi:UDP-N-acetylmuramate dehydrogenase
MLKIEKDHSLIKYTTLKISSQADYFAVIKNKSELLEAIKFAKDNQQAIFVLGGGSNVLLTNRIKGLLIKNEIKGIQVVKKNKDTILVEASSGEIWSKFVSYTVENKLYGLENLFLIYGTVGAAPVQNIGAYGVELKDYFYQLQAIDFKSGKEKTFSITDCRFGYRDSIFKNKFKGKYFIYSVTLKLLSKPNFKLNYGSIGAALINKGIKKPTAIDVIKTIEEIRNSKLPNPFVLPNAGSFFKNPEVNLQIFKKLLQQYPDMPSFPVSRTKVKIPAGWLIEQVGLKGKKFGPVRMYEKQALILVNEGGASAKQVLNLVAKVKLAVKKKFGLDLSEEVNII